MASDRDCPGQTVEQTLARMRAEFRAAGIGEAAGDARRLVAAALNVQASILIRDPARALNSSETALLDEYARRRLAREPVSRILGEREFYGRPFKLTPAVLDPRPDTETLVDAALAIARSTGWAGQPISILDIGTGSGAILLTLLAELPLATGLAIDVSSDALACAASNAQALGISQRAKFERRDIFEGLPEDFDLVVSNPPYIPTTIIPGLDPEVSLHDPTLALDGGCDGLAFYRAILEAWFARPHVQLRQRALVLEFGAGQSNAVIEIAEKYCDASTLTTLATHMDLGGHIRCLAIRQRSGAK